ncbi:acyl-CoA dehydrogenase [soil metagenome]
MSAHIITTTPAMAHAFWPILYLVWEDNVLTVEERDAINNFLQEQPWISVEEREYVVSKLDPNLPPSSAEMRKWKQKITEVAAESDDIAIAAIRLVREQDTTDARLKQVGAGLRQLESALGIIGKEAIFTFKPGHNTLTQQYDTTENFEVANMTTLLDGEQAPIINKVKALLSEPQFAYVDSSNMHAYREQVMEWCKALAVKGLGAAAYPKEFGGGGDMKGYFSIMETLSYHDLSLVIKFGVQFGLWGMSVYMLGTEKHHRKYLKEVGTLQLPGCFAMTETGHGSNVKGLQTTATYNHTEQTFTIHTPNENARKEYIGNAAVHGEMATVFAKLVIDGHDYGVNAFIVPLRNKVKELLPGITIKDCGRKMGLNGVDNGVIYFDNVVIPKENMLDRFASVNETGEFESPIGSDNRRFFTMLGTLVGGRIGIPRSALAAGKSGLAIAIRYGNRRRQFGPEGSVEVPILNYRMHQRRLIPLLANAYALHFALQYLTERFLNRTEEDMQEIEALAAGLKAYATWNTTATLQECREACGGKGYLSENRFDALKNDTEVYTTFEGDNTVLTQLVAKSRLAEFKKSFSGMNLMGGISYLAGQARTSIREKNPLIKRRTDEEHLLDPQFQISAFRYREEEILSSAGRRLKRLVDDGMDSFDATNVAQHHLVNVGLAYIERVVLEQFILHVENTQDEGCRNALKKLCDLFALHTIEKNQGWYLEEDYMEGVKTKAIRKLVNQLCWDIRQDAVPLVNAFNIPDNCLAAPIAF